MGDPGRGSAVALADQTWVLTGAAGGIGSSVRAGLAEQVARLRLLDIAPVDPRHPHEEAVRADVRDQVAVEAALAGADGVLHLGGIADEADFHDLAEVNIVGTFHVLEAARRAGVGRLVFASSNRTTGFYDASTVVDTTMPTRPDGLYGVSKVAGEALGRLYADKFGLAVACVRIGSFEQSPQDLRQLATWLSPADCLRAFLAAMSAPDLGYAVFYAASRNGGRWWDLRAGRALGYEPADDAAAYASQLPGEYTGPQGGRFADPEYTLDRQRDSGSARPRPGALHHVELWVPDLGRAVAEWGWLLGELGYGPFQDWPAGRSWRLGSTYVVVEQSPALAAAEHDRLRPGLNHLAFHAGDRTRVDALAAAAPGHGWTVLFADRHPYAGGPEHYAAYLANSDGYEVELVADG